jgi:hypothetical protein
VPREICMRLACEHDRAAVRMEAQHEHAVVILGERQVLVLLEVGRANIAWADLLRPDRHGLVRGGSAAHRRDRAASGRRCKARVRRRLLGVREDSRLQPMGYEIVALFVFTWTGAAIV